MFVSRIYIFISNKILLFIKVCFLVLLIFIYFYIFSFIYTSFFIFFILIKSTKKFSFEPKLKDEKIKLNGLRK